MRRSLLAIAIALAAWIVPVSASYAGASTPHIMHRTINYTAAQCSVMYAPFTKAADRLGAAARANAGHSCYAVVDAYGGPPNAVNGALASWCYGYWTGWNFYTYLGIWLFTNHVNVGMCFNGSVAWKIWGVDCYADFAIPGYSYSYSWCGMYQNNTGAAQAGNNYDIAVIVSGFPEQGHGWQRDYFNGSYLSYVYGCWQDVCAYGYT